MTRVGSQRHRQKILLVIFVIKIESVFIFGSIFTQFLNSSFDNLLPSKNAFFFITYFLLRVINFNSEPKLT